MEGRPHSVASRRHVRLHPSAWKSGLGRKVCKSKGIPIFNTVGEAVTLGGKELAVDGVVLVGEHGIYHSNLKGQKYYPRWWLYQQIIRVFEQSKRSVPVFNDKHFSTSWDEAKWMFDKSRELDFPLNGGSSIPFYYRKPEIDLDIDTPLKASVVAGGLEMREACSIVSTCSSALSNAAKAVRQASRRCSAFEGLKHGSGPNAILGRAICLMPCGQALT